MKLLATLIEESTERRQVFVEREGDSLAIRSPEGHEVARWTLNCVSYERSNNGFVTLKSPPGPLAIEMREGDFGKARWTRELPGYKHRGVSSIVLLSVGSCGALALLLVVGTPVLASLLPFSIERSVFERFDPVPDSEKCSPSKNPAAEAALQKLVTRIYPINEDDRKFSIDVHVARKKEINAFALPGGRIYINDGLLKRAQSGDEVAGVLAHEITHVKERHVIKSAADRLLALLLFPRYARIQSLVNLKFSKKQEAAADAGAISRLGEAKVNTAGLKKFFERMEKEPEVPSFLSDHPAMSDRARQIPTQPVGETMPALSAEEWLALKSYCGTY